MFITFLPVCGLFAARLDFWSVLKLDPLAVFEYSLMWDLSGDLGGRSIAEVACFFCRRFSSGGLPGPLDLGLGLGLVGALLKRPWISEGPREGAFRGGFEAWVNFVGWKFFERIGGLKLRRIWVLGFGWFCGARDWFMATM